MSKANCAKLKQGIAVRFHGEEGMVSVQISVVKITAYKRLKSPCIKFNI